jgi:hypothetical protein
MNVSMNPIPVQPTPGCWQNFVSGAKSTGSFIATKLENAGSFLWEGVKKTAILAANFFCALKTGLCLFVKVYARELIIGSVFLAAGVVIGLLANRFFGCCNSKSEEVVPNEPEKEVAEELQKDPQDVNTTEVLTHVETPAPTTTVASIGDLAEEVAATARKEDPGLNPIG